VHASPDVRPGTATTGPTTAETGEKEIPLQSTGAEVSGAAVLFHDYEGKPTTEELKSLRRVADRLPTVAYVLCFAELCERASYYGTANVIGNFVNRNLPVGSKTGAPVKGHIEQTAGALGMGLSKANAVTQSFKMLVYVLPVLFGWISDVYTGRFPMIIYGVFVCGVAHVVLMASTAPSVLTGGNATAPFFIGLYVLAIGAAMFKPCVSPLYLDQMRSTQPTVRTEKSGERVIVDTDATTESAVLWFYGFINIGALMGIPAAYAEKYVGWALTFGLPLAIWAFLPAVLFWVKPRLVLHPPGGSDLGRCCRVVGLCLKRNWKRIGRHGFWEAAKPSVIAASGSNVQVPWNDDFVEDVRRTFQACGMFCFFPIQAINDNGLGSAADGINTMLSSGGVPNDFLQNFNSILIIVTAPILNYLFYPALRKWHVRYGPVARITTGLFFAAIGGTGYTVLNYYAYKTSPCGKYGSSLSCVDGEGNALFSPISIWFIAIPYAIGGFSELFINVPAYGIAYSRAPVNMRGLVSALNLLTQGVTYAFGLAFSGLIHDPYLTWVFGGPAIVGYVSALVFWWLFHHIDNEEYMLSKNDKRGQESESEVDSISNHEIDEKGVRV